MIDGRVRARYVVDRDVSSNPDQPLPGGMSPRTLREQVPGRQGDRTSDLRVVISSLLST
jgi:hypothetical protein